MYCSLLPRYFNTRYFNTTRFQKYDTDTYPLQKYCVYFLTVTLFLSKKITMADTDLRTRMMGGKERENSVMKTMILFSLAMIFFPVFMYFFSKRAFFEVFLGYSSQDSYFYAAFVAIGTVHIILGAFVYTAFMEDTETSYKAD